MRRTPRPGRSAPDARRDDRPGGSRASQRPCWNGQRGRPTLFVELQLKPDLLQGASNLPPHGHRLASGGRTTRSARSPSARRNARECALPLTRNRQSCSVAEPTPTQNGTSSSRSQSSDSSIEASALASPASSTVATFSPIACGSAESKSETRSPNGAPPDVRPTAQISSPPHSTQPMSAKRCASVRSTSSPTSAGVSRPATALGARRPSGRPACSAVSLRHGPEL